LKAGEAKTSGHCSGEPFTYPHAGSSIAIIYQRTGVPKGDQRSVNKPCG